MKIAASEALLFIKTTRYLLLRAASHRRAPDTHCLAAFLPVSEAVAPSYSHYFLQKQVWTC